MHSTENRDILDRYQSVPQVTLNSIRTYLNLHEQNRIISYIIFSFIFYLIVIVCRNRSTHFYMIDTYSIKLFKNDTYEMEDKDNNYVWWKWLMIFFAKSDNFKDFIAFILIFGYFFQLFRGLIISNEYMVLLGMAIGNYFKHGK